MLTFRGGSGGGSRIQLILGDSLLIFDFGYKCENQTRASLAKTGDCVDPHN